MRKLGTLKIDEAPDFLAPGHIARLLDIADANAYSLFNIKGFPGRRVGRRLLVSKRAFLDWWERQ